MTAPKIIALAGSLRKDSFNQQLINEAARFALESGAEVEIIKLADLNIPLFNQDIEAQGTPADVQLLKEKLRAADGILLASPEYNGSITAALKNAIDWASRTEQGAVPAFRNKVVALFAASPGGLGGLRGLNHVRDILSGVGSLVLADQLAVPAVHTVLDENGQINNPNTAEKVSALAQQLVTVASKLS
ncbi:NAD(P)H-dependent oxidoreductase [Pseudoalteromonas sp. HL-AS2]|uniref:Oxidoreductase n=1 Tax=Pseudoalteromonas translucida (strain TAC 125) TaxID=326442 RepID=Q3IJT0_PSET1|nr:MULTISPECIES: NAD(P)H-dependent oxidoreductase [Pseudoalteromonas]MBB1407337.1 NAD(P)H-dependent oxidoreductase [Pseudoalteromonas sp. SG44-5]MBE0420073.1 NAD(P)H-dependent oxidoreductase [Pseudoalteromonas nigrifaciens]MBO7927802.1 NAD(P)H-dependent oxidoreductase [Pseudoalteromonas sp. K222D]PCC14325.1 NADPH-dependent oxidoreductase [Pseudoalteromonas sp. JB197]WMS94380.1 NAD(P)H-dependent oxidoreductase [Pseudoalteromonas sp. HL-AS2]